MRLQNCWSVSRIWQSDDVYEKCDDISIVNGFLQEGTETEETGHGLVGQAPGSGVSIPGSLEASEFGFNF